MTFSARMLYIIVMLCSLLFMNWCCFKYMVHNDEEGKDYCTGFAFEGEFVSDFPYCRDGDMSEMCNSELHIFSGVRATVQNIQ